MAASRFALTPEVSVALGAGHALALLIVEKKGTFTTTSALLEHYEVETVGFGISKVKMTFGSSLGKLAIEVLTVDRAKIFKSSHHRPTVLAVKVEGRIPLDGKLAFTDPDPAQVSREIDFTQSSGFDRECLEKIFKLVAPYGMTAKEELLRGVVALLFAGPGQPVYKECRNRGENFSLREGYQMESVAFSGLSEYLIAQEWAEERRQKLLSSGAARASRQKLADAGMQVERRRGRGCS